MEVNNISANNVNVTVLQILKVSSVKQVRTLLSLTGMLMGIGTVHIYAVVFRFSFPQFTCDTN